MIIIKNKLITLIIVCILFSVSGCTQKPQKPQKSENGPPEMPKVIEEIENDILKVMTLSDQVPYFERVIVEKEKIEEKKKMEQLQMAEAAGSSEKPQGQSSESQNQGNGGKSEESTKPMTIEESILVEILKREKNPPEEKQEEKPPKDIAETWRTIHSTIKGLHDKWNVLEPLLIQQSVSPEVMAGFEDTLDSLTNLGISKNYFGTIATANRLTAYLPKFMTPFKKDIPPTVYNLKFHLRDVILNVAVDNYPQAQESLNQIKEQGQSIKSQLIEKKAKSTADKFDASVINLQKSLDKKDMNLLKINGAIVMKNIMLMKDDLAGSV